LVSGTITLQINLQDGGALYNLGLEVLDSYQLNTSIYQDFDANSFIPGVVIFSAPVSIILPELRVLAAYQSPYPEVAIIKKWYLDVTYYNITIPNNIQNEHICLAYQEKIFGAQGPYFQWTCYDRCVDVIRHNTTATITGSIPIYNVINGTYLVLLWDPTDKFPPFINVGGGIFAAGIIFLIVLGTVLLANRENIGNTIRTHLCSNAE